MDKVVIVMDYHDGLSIATYPRNPATGRRNTFIIFQRLLPRGFIPPFLWSDPPANIFGWRDVLRSRGR